MHAEQNAVITAARFGVSIAGCTAYSTLRPCFNCTKEMLQGGIVRVLYLHELGDEHRDADIHRMYIDLQMQFKNGVHRLDMEDPEKEWANGK